MVKAPSIFPSELELHRAAAWWAGEGSVRSKDRKLTVTFAQKEISVCHWFQERFGGSVYTRAATEKRGEISTWALSGDNARAFLNSIVILLPESPRRQEQIRSALSATAGKLKTGPKPSPLCVRGHTKEAGRCKECAAIWKASSRSKPDVAQRHRDRERDRYQQRRAT